MVSKNWTWNSGTPIITRRHTQFCSKPVWTWLQSTTTFNESEKYVQNGCLFQGILGCRYLKNEKFDSLIELYIESKYTKFLLNSTKSICL